MAEETIVIVCGGLEVTSTIEAVPASGGRVVVRVKTLCGDHCQINTVTLSGGQDYSAEQAEYDIEMARHQFAREAAGKAHTQAIAQALVQPSSLQPTVVTGGPRIAKPAKR